VTDLAFTIRDIVVEPYAAAPQLTAKLHIEESTGAVIHAVALRCQVQIEPKRRGYQPAEAAALTDQFGSRDRWATTLKPFQWMQCSVMVQGFTGSTDVDLPMPVTYDFEVTASRYLHALRNDMVPVLVLFSGTVFTRGDGGFEVEQVPWDREARFAMPVSVWRDLVERYFPNSGWLRLDSDTLAALAGLKSAGGFLTWDEMIWSLLARSGESAS
jgi:uncharacterized protein DUF6084